MQARSWRTSTSAAVLAAVVGSVALAGCGGDEPDDALTSAAQPSSTLATSTTTAPASTSTTASTTAAQGPGLPGVPANARTNSPEAAAAFVRHYIDQVNAIGQAPRKGVLEKFGLPGCKACAAFSGTVSGLVDHSSRYSGPTMDVQVARQVVGESGMAIQVQYDQPAVSILGQDGQASQKLPATVGESGVFLLQWSGAGWRVQEIKSESQKPATS